MQIFMLAETIIGEEANMKRGKTLKEVGLREKT
jgi:hypothetical protein